MTGNKSKFIAYFLTRDPILAGEGRVISPLPDAFPLIT